MNPFAVEQIWHAGRPVKVAERGSTLALLVEATVRRITAVAASPTGCPCCRCAIAIRRAADLQSVTVAVAYSDVEEFRALARVYCARCAPDADTAEATAAQEYRRWHCASASACRRRRRGSLRGNTRQAPAA